MSFQVFYSNCYKVVLAKLVNEQVLTCHRGLIVTRTLAINLRSQKEQLLYSTSVYVSVICLICELLSLPLYYLIWFIKELWCVRITHTTLISSSIMMKKLAFQHTIVSKMPLKAAVTDFWNTLNNWLDLITNLL